MLNRFHSRFNGLRRQERSGGSGRVYTLGDVHGSSNGGSGGDSQESTGRLDRAEGRRFICLRFPHFVTAQVIPGNWLGFFQAISNQQSAISPKGRRWLKRKSIDKGWKLSARLKIGFVSSTEVAVVQVLSGAIRNSPQIGNSFYWLSI
jgi:hypothetical protein